MPIRVPSTATLDPLARLAASLRDLLAAHPGDLPRAAVQDLLDTLQPTPQEQ